MASSSFLACALSTHPICWVTGQRRASSHNSHLTSSHSQDKPRAAPLWRQNKVTCNSAFQPSRDPECQRREEQRIIIQPPVHPINPISTSDLNNLGRRAQHSTAQPQPTNHRASSYTTLLNQKHPRVSDPSKERNNKAFLHGTSLAATTRQESALRSWLTACARQDCLLPLRLLLGLTLEIIPYQKQSGAIAFHSCNITQKKGCVALYPVIACARNGTLHVCRLRLCDTSPMVAGGRRSLIHDYMYLRTRPRRLSMLLAIVGPIGIEGGWKALHSYHFTYTY